MIAYRIKGWKEHYENNRTREMLVMRWVPVPNKHDGEGFQIIMEQDDALKIYACWHLILQVASKCRTRGTLLRDDGTPHTAGSIARKCSCRDIPAMQRALDFCSNGQVSWLETFAIEPAEIPHPPAEIPHKPARNGMEGNGMEGNGKTGEDVPVQSAQTPPERKPRKILMADDGEWFAEIKAQFAKIGIDADFEAVRAKAWLMKTANRHRRFTQSFFINWLNKADRNVNQPQTATPQRDFKKW